jgi:formamidopyrimidine-DNA glycosylase
VGVGNIYASEALFRARIARAQARSLTAPGMRRLARAIKATLTMAVKVGGTTLRDYVGADGNPGYFRQKLYVYERAGKPCRVCGKPVKQFTQGQRSTYWCSTARNERRARIARVNTPAPCARRPDSPRSSGARARSTRFLRT